jgi:hypothetical protein
MLSPEFDVLGTGASLTERKTMTAFSTKFAIMGVITTFLIFSTAHGDEVAESAEPDNMSFGAQVMMAKYDNTSIEVDPAYAFRIANSSGLIQLGIEFQFQYHIPHSYDYQVPYITQTETRAYHTLGGNLLFRLVPIRTRWLALFLGGFGGTALVVDQASKSTVRGASIKKSTIYNAGPSVGFDLLPRSGISLTFELRRQYHLLGTLSREKIDHIDMGGNVPLTTENIKMDAWYAGGGFRFNF